MTTPQKSIDVITYLEKDIQPELDLLKKLDEAWQPSDLLPDAGAPDWHEQFAELQEEAKSLSPELLIVLTGDMITEEALPSYHGWLSRIHGIGQDPGASPSRWAQWIRGWSAEENRHGDILNRYLYLSARVDFGAVERSIHSLIMNGFDPGDAMDPYKAFVYTAFQERATRISHANTATLAREQGAVRLSKICANVASDEARHEKAYKHFIRRSLELDPEGVVLAFEHMMRNTIQMPAKLMDENAESNLYEVFADTAQQIGVYTALDYAEIIQHLVDYWSLDKVSLTGEHAKAQDYLCGLSARYKKLGERMMAKKKTPIISPVMNWIR